MEREDKNKGVARRSFLKGTGTAVVGAAAAVAAVGTAQAAAAEPARDDAAYRETEHVRRYYDLASKF